MSVIQGEEIMGYKIPEIRDLDERGLVIQYSEPLCLERESDVEALRSMILAAERAGSPYLVTALGADETVSRENVSYFGKAIVWKENKAIRCKKCRGYLGRRPAKFKPCLTHKHVGMKCFDAM